LSTSIADPGASSGGLMMMEQPAPMAAPSFRAGLPIGKFQGQKAATGPHEHPPVDPPGLTGVEIEQAGGHQQLTLRFPQRLAFLHGGNGGYPLDPLAQQARGAGKYIAALVCGLAAPNAKAPCRRVQGAIQIGGCGERELAERLTRRRVDDRVRRSAARPDSFTIDVERQVCVVAPSHGSLRQFSTCGRLRCRI
jgi:hypothetical protein